MFDRFKKSKETSVYAPMDGTTKALSDVPDEAFSEKMLGDGIAVIPENGAVYSPVDGVISDITDTKHAFCITADDGAELLLHIGINTVNLKGDGFSVLVSAGEHVKKGDKIAQVDLSVLEKAELLPDTPLLLTEPEKYNISCCEHKKVRGGTDVLFTYKKN